MRSNVLLLYWGRGDDTSHCLNYHAPLISGVNNEGQPLTESVPVSSVVMALVSSRISDISRNVFFLLQSPQPQQASGLHVRMSADHPIQVCNASQQTSRMLDKRPRTIASGLNPFFSSKDSLTSTECLGTNRPPPRASEWWFRMVVRLFDASVLG